VRAQHQARPWVEASLEAGLILVVFATPCDAACRSKLPQSYPNYKTVHRHFQTWCRDEVLRRVLMDVANELRDRGALDEEECFIDATFVMAKGGGAEIGTTRRGKGMKIMG
jgi:hypothetical protein